MEWCRETGGDAAECRDRGDGEGGGTTCDNSKVSNAVCGFVVGRMGPISEYVDHYVYVLWAEGHWMMGCAELLANEARTMSGVKGVGVQK